MEYRNIYLGSPCRKIEPIWKLWDLTYMYSQIQTRSGSVLTRLISPAATNSSFSISRSKSRSRPQGKSIGHILASW